eukprot:170255-Prymnesium_polylepis.1
MIEPNSTVFASSAACSSASAGISECVSSVAAAMDMAVGKESFDDWPMLQWSFGCTGVFEPSSPPSIWIARLLTTSLTFMLVCVPEPVWKTTRGKWADSLPEITSSAAATMALLISGSSLPMSVLYCAAHFLRTPNALITGSGICAAVPPMGKFCRLRCVCAPQSTSSATSIGPN